MIKAKSPSTKKSSVLLTGNPTIPFDPVLARTFGHCGALLLQQVHFKTLTNPAPHDGKAWHYTTYKKWADQLGGFSIKTIQRCFTELEEAGVIVSGAFNKMAADRTKWYRIDYPTLSNKLGLACGPIGLVQVDKLSSATGQIDLTVHKTSYKTSGKEKEAANAAALSDDYKDKEDSGKDEIINVVESTVMAIQNAHQEAKLGPIATDNNNPAALANLWRNAVAKHCAEV